MKSLSSSSQSRRGNPFPRLLCPVLPPKPAQRETQHLPALLMDQSWSFQLLPGAPRTFRDEGSRAGVCGNKRETTKSPGRMDGRGGGELLWLRKGKGLVERNAIKAPWRQNRVMERSVPFNNALFFFLVQMKYLATSTGRVQLEVNDQTGGP